MEDILKIVRVQQDEFPTTWQKIPFCCFIAHLVDGDLIIYPTPKDLMESKATRNVASGGVMEKLQKPDADGLAREERKFRLPDWIQKEKRD